MPIGATFYIIYKSFVWLDSLLPTEIPGLGILIIIGAVTLIGFIGNYLITAPVISVGNRILKKAPLIKIIYTSVKDLLTAFVGKQRSFTQPVLFKVYENSEIRRLGFVTDEDLKKLDASEDLVGVYAPHSYAFSGQLFFIPKSYIQPVPASSADVMKYIISGGVTRVEEKEIKPKMKP